MYFEQIDMAREVGRQIKDGPKQLLVVLMDALQTPPVVEKEKQQANPGAEMLWDGTFYRDALARNEVAKFSLETVYSTSDPKLKALGKALRSEDDATALPLVNEFSTTVYDHTFTDVVHDNSEIYDISAAKHGSKAGAQAVHARCETGGPSPDLTQWPTELQRQVREQSKMLVELIVYEGQQLHYEPIGKTGAKTDGGWFLGKGELVEVVKFYPSTNQFRVRCLKLKGKPLAWIPEEFVRIKLVGYGSVKLYGPPMRYPDIVTVYSGQGSRFEKVHVHARRFKGQRNLLYTACTRASKVLKISGIALDDDGDDLRDKMELHPKSVLWQADLGLGGFSEQRLAAARLEVEKMVQRGSVASRC